MFDRTFAEKHNVKVMGGFEYNYNLQRDMGFFPFNGNVGYLDNRFSTLTSTMNWAPNADSSLVNGAAISGYNSRFITAWNSVFARFNYAFSGKYLFEASFRRDGSSNFGPNRRFGNFGAVGAGWIISDESFWQNIPVVNFAKLRASFGTQGNPGFATSQWNASFGRVAGVTYLGQPILLPTRLFNPQLSWSTVYQTDIAIDFGLWNSKVTGSLGVYQRTSTDILFARPVQVSGTGYSRTIFVNDPESEIRDRGIEFNVSSTNLEGKLRWTTDFNIASNVNKVLSLGDLGPDAIDVGPGDARILLGQPQGVFFLAEFAGVNPETGQEEILNGERILATQENVRNNRKPVGNPFPKAFGGFGNTFFYKGFDLNIFFTYSFGQDIYDDGAKRQVGAFLNQWNQRRDVLDRWQRPGDQTDVPRLTLNSSAGDWNNTTRWLYDASFVRLRTLQLGYTIPKDFLSKTKLQNIRVYIAGQNLLTFTTFPAWDPEVTRATEDPGVGNVSWNSPYLATPQMRTLTAGINIGF
ncbi:MAG: TonB-dependent receptor SusC [candidate division WS2 bacterium]|uniref:TonB-dependent receptor SusC n=1 Tax=Psychracetigena formicireducens TaxID=2986056 RepID=A0A9E2BIU6_PSYF1|nr:TonB-dependent receptor SusC [Candidatus Psychracetigena formicireducens]